MSPAHHRFVQVTALLLGLAAAPDAFAQTVPTSLTLSDAMRRAAADPPAVRASLARVHAAEAQAATARTGYLPTLNATGTAAMGYSDQPVLSNVRYQSVTASVGASVTARIPIYDFGRTAGAVDAASRGADASREDLRLARAQAAAQVAQLYLAVLSDAETVAAAGVTITQREAHLRVADGLVAAGTRPPVERVRAALDLDAARLDLAVAEARERGDRAALAAALGIDPLRPIALAPVDERDLAVNDDAAWAAAQSVARPDFAAARQRLMQAEAQVEAARAARRPSLTGQASASVSYAEALSGQGAFGLSGQAQAGLSLTIPVFDATLGANVRSAEAAVVNAQEALAQQSLTVRTNAVQAAISLQGARAALAQSERVAEQAAVNLAQVEGRYQGGTAPLLEVIDAQTVDANARMTTVRARLQRQVAAVNLLVAIDALRP